MALVELFEFNGAYYPAASRADTTNQKRFTGSAPPNTTTGVVLAIDDEWYSTGQSGGYGSGGYGLIPYGS